MKIRSFIKLCAKIYKTKAAKVALLGVCSTMLLVSSGASFAKYYSENGFGDGASIAELGDGVIYYNYEMNQTPAGLDPISDYGIHAFIAQFKIEFSASEVARTFDLEFRMSKTPSTDYEAYEKATQTSFYLNDSFKNDSGLYPTYITKITNDVGTSYKVSDSLSVPDKIIVGLDDDSSSEDDDIKLPIDDTNREKWDEIAKSGITTFETNKIYFGYVENESDIETTTDTDGKTTIKDIDYKWKSINYTALKDPKDEDVLSNTNIDFITEGKIGDLYDCKLGLEAKTYYFSIVFFSEITSGMTTEDTKMLYKLSISQRQ